MVTARLMVTMVTAGVDNFYGADLLMFLGRWILRFLSFHWRKDLDRARTLFVVFRIAAFLFVVRRRDGDVKTSILECLYTIFN